MEATPSNVNYDAVEAAIKKVEGVEDVHDLHIWCLTNGKNALSAHITAHDPFRTLKKVEHELKHHQKMAHVTIQIENPNHGHEHKFSCKSSLHSPSITISPRRSNTENHPFQYNNKPTRCQKLMFVLNE